MWLQSLNGVKTTVTGTNSTTIVYASTAAGVANSAVSETGTTVTVTNGIAPYLSPNTSLVTIAGVVPSGYNGTYTVTGVSTGAFTYTASAGLGTVSTLGTAVSPGFSSTQSSSAYALGYVSSTGISQGHYYAAFSPAQWIIGTVNTDTTNPTVRNWFFKLQGNTAILGGAGCYDLIGYYIGVEPQYQDQGTPPNPVACQSTAEYCGTNWLHITKDTIATNNPPLAGGCSTTPNYDVITVSGSAYIPVQNDQILSMYQANGYLDIYCLGTSRSVPMVSSVNRCPSTTNFTRVIHVYDSDMLSSFNGNSQGYPGVWAATAQYASTPMSIFTNISMGSITSGVTCSTITSTSCVNPSQYSPMSMVP